MCRISTKTSLLAKNNVVLPSNEGETGNLALLHQQKQEFVLKLVPSARQLSLQSAACVWFCIFLVHVVLHQALTKKLERIFQFHFLRKRYMFTVTSAYSTYISKQGRVLPVASRCCKEKCIPLIVFSESSQRKGDPGFKLTDFNLWIYKISNSLVYKKGKHACHQPSNLNHKLGFTDFVRS